MACTSDTKSNVIYAKSFFRVDVFNSSFTELIPGGLQVQFFADTVAADVYTLGGDADQLGDLFGGHAEFEEHADFDIVGGEGGALFQKIGGEIRVDGFEALFEDFPFVGTLDLGLDEVFEFGEAGLLVGGFDFVFDLMK